MDSTHPVVLKPITDQDIWPVAVFFHDHLNARLSSETWASSMVPTWRVNAPNHGFMLVQGDQVVGAHLAFYSERTIDDRLEKFCNLAALCVLEQFRGHSVRLIRALLGQDGYHFTDLSPSGNVVSMNRRLGFASLDTSTVLRVNLPSSSRGSVRIISDRRTIGQVLLGDELRVFRDHERAAATRHLLLVRSDQQCYVMVRKDRRKGLPLFASFLHVSNPVLLRECISPLCAHLLFRHGALFSLLETRVLGFRPPGRAFSQVRPKMFKSKTLDSGAIDYLYSELTCVSW